MVACNRNAEVVLLILGFPVAIVLAWMFETPAAVAKGKRRPGRPARTGRTDGDEAADAPRSIAVLPFVNMSDDKDNEYFSDGMTEEILNALTKVPGLRVASRTSSFAFKGQAKDVLEIAEDLRVDAVVEGGCAGQSMFGWEPKRFRGNAWRRYR